MGFFTSAAKEQQKIEHILSQFPGPVTLYPPRRRWIGFAVVSLVFVAMGVWLLDRPNPTLPTLFHLIMCYVGIILSGLMSACGIYLAIFPRTVRLTLRDSNFEAADWFKWNNCSAEWKDASNFMTIKRQTKTVAFYDASVTAPNSWPDVNLQKIGCNKILPRTYGFTAEALAELMTRWRERAVQS